MRTVTEININGCKNVEEYDEQDRLVRVTDYSLDGSIDYDTHYWYADDGRSEGFQSFNSNGFMVMRYEREHGSPYPERESTWRYNPTGELESREVATTDANGTLTIQYDANDNETERTQGLPSQGVPSNQRFYLIRNAAYSDLEEAERLVQENPSLIHERNSIGETAFHFLVVEDAHEAVQWLLAHGSDINTRNDTGNTPLLEAAGLGYMEMCRWLLANGADLHIQNENGETAISTVATSEQIEMLELLLAHVPSDEDINSYFNNLTANILLDKSGRSAELLKLRGLRTRRG